MDLVKTRLRKEIEEAVIEHSCEICEVITRNKRFCSNACKAIAQREGFYPQSGFRKGHLSFSEVHRFEKGHTPWNKGLNRENDERVRGVSNKAKGRCPSEETRLKMSIAVKKRIENGFQTPFMKYPGGFPKKKTGNFVNCAYCGKEKYLAPWELEESKQYYCDYNCYWNSLKGKSNPEWGEYLKKLYDQFPEKHPNRILAQKGHVTKIESVMAWALKQENIGFEPQFRIGRYYVDYYLPDTNVVVECDGEYWHRESDLERDKFIEGEGYIMLHFGEREILDNVYLCIDRIREVMNYGTKQTASRN